MLVKFVSTKKEAWSAYLDTCVFAYNTSRHESTKFTPFELMFGRKATLPIDVELQKDSPEEVCQKYHTLNEPNASAVLREHAQRLETAKQNILVAQQKQKENYDQKHAKPVRFQVDQVVLKKDFTRKKTKGGKLKERYLGPYTITKVHPHGTYELADPSNKSKTLRATGAHLKPYTAPSPPHGDITTPSPPNGDITSSSPHGDDMSDKGISNEESSEIKDKAFILSPPPSDEHPENTISLSLSNGDELSFLNSSIPILPPPMPSVQLLQHTHLPFPATAPLACSTPCTTIPLPSPKDLESEDDQEPRSKRRRECHSNKRKQNYKAAEKSVKSVKAKELMLKRRQRQLKVVKKPEVIDIDKYQPSQKSQKQKFWIKELNLLESDREILLNRTGLLTDSIIDAAQKLLKQAFPTLSGLQSVNCGLTMNFDIEPAEFVQVIHNGRGHWLTISTIGTSHPDVHVYDSMYPSAGTLVKAQAAALLHTELPEICLQFMNVQMQAGGYACGLFAVAFATALAFGKPPGQYHFDQAKMRRHLWNCFERRNMSLFPYSKLRRATESTIKSVEEVPVRCIAFVGCQS